MNVYEALNLPPALAQQLQIFPIKISCDLDFQPQQVYGVIQECQSL